MNQDELRRRLDELEARCTAQAKTIEVLVDTAEARQAARDGNAYEVFRRSQALQALVDEKTRALEEAVSRLGETQAKLAEARSQQAVQEFARDLLEKLAPPVEALGQLVDEEASCTSRELADAFTTLHALVRALRSQVG